MMFLPKIVTKMCSKYHGKTQFCVWWIIHVSSFAYSFELFSCLKFIFRGSWGQSNRNPIAAPYIHLIAFGCHVWNWKKTVVLLYFHIFSIQIVCLKLYKNKNEIFIIYAVRWTGDGVGKNLTCCYIPIFIHTLMSE